MLLSTIFTIVVIAIAVIFANVVKNKIDNYFSLNGIGWGIGNGLPLFFAGGIGFVLSLICVITAHSSINKKIDSVEDEKYSKYLKGQMKNFITTYSICFVIALVFSIISTSYVINNSK